MQRCARLGFVTAAALVLAGCGGGDDSAASKDPTPTVTATAAPAPEALSGFTCTAGEDGLWTARGTLVNDTTDAATFTLEVYIGPADGQERPATQETFEDVQPDESTPVELTGLSAQGEPATCHIRVMRDLA